MHTRIITRPRSSSCGIAMGTMVFEKSLTQASRRRRRCSRPALWPRRNSAATLRERSMWVDSTLMASRRTTPIGSTGGFRRTPRVKSPQRSITDGLCSYAAAMRQIDNGDHEEVGRRLNKRAENSHPGASPRSRRCPAPTFPGAVFSHTNSATDTVPLRLTVATTARDAGRLRGPAHRIPEDFAVSPRWDSCVYRLSWQRKRTPRS